MLFCYGRSVACVVAVEASQTTIASSGEEARAKGGTNTPDPLTKPTQRKLIVE
jgi:hypothetical protein